MANETNSANTPSGTPQPNDYAGMSTPPQTEHEWLQQLVGDWTFESECIGEPGKPTEKCRGSEHVKPLGDLWVIGEGQGEMPGGGIGHMRITLGFDPKRNRFVGSWIGSMMAHHWVYDGELDASGRVLTLNADGPSFTGDGSITKYQDIIEFKDTDTRTLTSRSLGDDGKWTQFMAAHYRRNK